MQHVFQGWLSEPVSSGDPAVTLLVQVLSPLPLCTSPSTCGFRNVSEENLLLLPFFSDAEAVILPF